MISPSIVSTFFSCLFVAVLFLRIIFNKIFLVIGTNKINPTTSVKKPGIINNRAAKAIDAPDISS